MQRYAFIDAIRGIAALSVMLQHSLYQSGLLGDFAHHATLTGFIPTRLELGETGVVAFFLVSGFVIPLSLEKTASFKLFWLHRVFRIYPLYLFIYFLTFLVLAGAGLHSLSAISLNFLSHLFFVQEYLHQTGFVGGSWTLSLEMVWYIAISGLFLVSLNKSTSLIVALAVAISLVADTACILGHHLPMGRVSMLDCCVTGLLCYRHERQHIAARRFSGLLAIMLCLIASNLLNGLQYFPSPHPTASFEEAGPSWSLAALIFFVPFLLRRSSFWGLAGFKFTGRISYSIYLLHPVILILLSRTQITGPLLIVVTFGVTITLAWLSYKFIESPAIRYGHTIGTSAYRASVPQGA